MGEEASVIFGYLLRASCAGVRGNSTTDSGFVENREVAEPNKINGSPQNQIETDADCGRKEISRLYDSVPGDVYEQEAAAPQLHIQYRNGFGLAH